MHHLDRLFWQPGWQPADRADFEAAQDEILQRSAWIIEGTYVSTLPARLALADTVIWLDYPRWICLWRVLTRWRTYAGRPRPDMTEGCPERMELEFLRYIWSFQRVIRPRMAEALKSAAGTIALHIHRSPAETARFLARLPQDS